MPETKLPETFETRRLVARKPRLSDVAAIFEKYAKDEDVTRYLIWKPYTEVESLGIWLENVISSFGGRKNEYVITTRDNDELVGMASISVHGHQATLGYVFEKRSWGNGYATEVATYLVDWVLAQENLYRASAVCDIDNTASARVMEKAGMQREGILRRWCLHPNVSDKPRDVICCAKTK